MKIIISPAKNMIIRSDDLFSVTTPVFLKQTKKLYDYLKKMNVDELNKFCKLMIKLCGNIISIISILILIRN